MSTPVTQIQLRRGTSLQWASSTTPLAEGELGYANDTGELRIGKFRGSFWSSSNIVGSSFSGPTGSVIFSQDGRSFTGSSIFTFNPNTGYGGYTGLATITGGLKVVGPIDPVSLTLTPQLSNPMPGLTGTLWYNSVTGKLTMDNVVVGSGTGSTGPTGQSGIQGPTGAQGPIGAPGSGTAYTGPQGSVGAEGSTGPQGPTGADGPPGTPGSILPYLLQHGNATVSDNLAVNVSLTPPYQAYSSDQYRVLLTSYNATAIAYVSNKAAGSFDINISTGTSVNVDWLTVGTPAS